MKKQFLLLGLVIAYSSTVFAPVGARKASPGQPSSGGQGAGQGSKSGATPYTSASQAVAAAQGAGGSALADLLAGAIQAANVEGGDADSEWGKVGAAMVKSGKAPAPTSKASSKLGRLGK